MSTATIQDIQARLPEILDSLSPGDEVVITRDGEPIARIVTGETPSRQPRKAGRAKGILVILQEDDDHLKDFSAVME